MNTQQTPNAQDSLSKLKSLTLEEATTHPYPWASVLGHVKHSRGDWYTHLGVQNTRKSPGWPVGRTRRRHERHDLIYSEEWRVRRAHQQPITKDQKPKIGRPKKLMPTVVT